MNMTPGDKGDGNPYPRGGDAWRDGQGNARSVEETARLLNLPLSVTEPDRPDVPTQVASTSGEVRTRINNRNVTDLVTGETVVTIPVREATAADSIQISPNDIAGLASLYENGRSGNIRRIVEEVDRVLMPGFRYLLGTEEWSQLDNASPELSQKIHSEIRRMFMAFRARMHIEKVSRGLEAHISPLVEKMQTPARRASVQLCLDMWRRNMNNPHCNFYERTRQHFSGDTKVHNQYTGPLLSINPQYFSVGLLGRDAEKHAGAGFSAAAQVMLLREAPHSSDEISFLDALAVIHELTHKQFDAKRAETYGPDSEAYQSVCAVIPDKPNGLVDEDPAAFANEVELLMAKTGFGELTTGSIAKSIGANLPADTARINHLFAYAQSYFSQPTQHDGSPHQDFITYWEADYRKFGAEIYMLNQAGVYVRKH